MARPGTSEVAGTEGMDLGSAIWRSDSSTVIAARVKRALHAWPSHGCERGGAVRRALTPGGLAVVDRKQTTRSPETSSQQAASGRVRPAGPVESVRAGGGAAMPLGSAGIRLRDDNRWAIPSCGGRTRADRAYSVCRAQR
jgi:hypothetical protein